MWFEHRAWMPVAWVLSFGNLGAVWFAAQPAEPWHATAHAFLALLFGVGAQRLMSRQAPAAGQHRLDELQQTVDVIALEVERISEGQRFVTKALNETLRIPVDSEAGESSAINRPER